MQNHSSANTSAYDVVIIGGGNIGLACALELSKRGKKVALLEKNKVGKEAGWASGGMLQPVAESIDEDMLSLTLESFSLYREFVKDLEEESGLRLEYNDKGGIMIAYDEADIEVLESKHHMGRSHGVASQLLTSEEVLEIEPKVSDDILKGLFIPNDHHLDNRALLEALEICLRKSDCSIIEDCEVLEIDTGYAQTSKGRFEAPHIVNCSGAWASEIDSAVPIEPIRGQMLRFKVDELPISHIVSKHPYYLIPRFDNTVILGSTVENVGFDKRVTTEGIEHLKEIGEKMLPNITKNDIIETWCGFRPKTSDGKPVVGKVREGVYLACGHFRKGILLTPLTARLIANIIEGGEEDPRVSPRRLL